MPVPELSPTEERVAFLSAAGRSNREIADSMGVTLRTIEWHLARARRKLARAAELHDRIHRAEPEAPRNADGCYRTTGGVPPASDDENPALG